MQIGLWTVQKWEGGTRVQSAEDGVRGKVGAWHDRLQSADYRLRRKGRSVASPRPCFHRRSRRSLAPTRERSSLEAARLARSANPTRYKVKSGTGDRDVGRRTDVVSELSNRQTLTAIRGGQHVVLPLPSRHPCDQPLIHVANWAKALARWLSLSLVCGWSSPKVLSKPLGTKSES